MEKILVILNVLVGLAYTIFAFPDGGVAALLILFLSIPAIFLIRHYSEEKTLLTNIFLAAPVIFGIVVIIVPPGFKKAAKAAIQSSVGVKCSATPPE